MTLFFSLFFESLACDYCFRLHAVSGHKLPLCQSLSYLGTLILFHLCSVLSHFYPILVSSPHLLKKKKQPYTSLQFLQSPGFPFQAHFPFL